MRVESATISRVQGWNLPQAELSSNRGKAGALLGSFERVRNVRKQQSASDKSSFD